MKNIYLWCFITFLFVLIGCNKDNLIADSENSSSLLRERTDGENPCELFISYDITKKESISLEDGSEVPKDCAYDLISNLHAHAVTQSFESCVNKNHSPCTKIRNTNLRRNRGSNDEQTKEKQIKSIEFCNGNTTVTTEDGQVETTTSSFLYEAVSTFNYLLMTEEEIDSTMTAFVASLDEQQADYTIEGDYLTLYNTFEDGSKSVVNYDLNTGLPISEIMTDENGEVVFLSINSFKCTDDGKLVIDGSKIIEKLISYYCSEELVKTTYTKYSNIKIKNF